MSDHEFLCVGNVLSVMSVSILTYRVRIVSDYADVPCVRWRIAASWT